MDNQDRVLEQRIRDIVAVATPDIDAIMVEVEDGVAYVEGVVPTAGQRKVLLNTIRRLPGLDRLISCVAAEHVFTGTSTEGVDTPCPLVMHYYSLS